MLMRHFVECFRKITKSLNKGSVEAFEVVVLRKSELDAAFVEYDSCRAFGYGKDSPQYPRPNTRPSFEVCADGGN